VKATLRNLLFCAVLVLVAILVYNVTRRFTPSNGRETFSAFLARVHMGEVDSVTFLENGITYITRQGQHLRTVVPQGYQSLPNQLIDWQVQVDAVLATPSWAPVLHTWVAIAAFMGFLLFFYPSWRGRDFDQPA
jgi:hypothetical protein